MSFRQGLPICGLFCVIHLLMVGDAIGTYFSGATPTAYYKGDEINVKVGELTSFKTWISLSYYSIPHCQPEKIVDTTNFAQVLGANSENSMYKFKMLESERCHVVCRAELDAKMAKEFQEKIEDGYRVNMILDDLPLVLVNARSVNYQSNDQQGFRLGFAWQSDGEHKNRYFIYNHLSFNVKYSRDIQLKSTNIVGFEAKAFSVNHHESTWGGKTGLITCELHESVLHLSGPQEVKEGEEVIFTYSVNFEETDLNWPSRWEVYDVPTNSRFRWPSILRSFLFLAAVSVKLGKLIYRTIRPDGAGFSELMSQDVAQQERRCTSGNKDVISPCFPHLFCVCIGTGILVLGAVLGTLISTTLGFLAPSDRGSRVAIMLMVWGYMGLLTGYTSTWLHKLIQGKSHWSIISLTTAVAFPTTVFIIYSALNNLVHWKISGTLANAFKYGSLTLILPALLGGYIGSGNTVLNSQATSESESSVQLPDQQWTRRRVFYILLGGILPYAAVDTEIFYLVKSIYMHQLYSSYRFLLLSFILLIITCAVLSVFQCYNQFSNGNYNCWWQSFLVAGSSALHFLISLVYVVLIQLGVRKPASVTLFIGYILIAVPSFFLMCGTIGFFACLWFTKVFHSAIKTD